jgi:hypothetical protein
MVAEIVLPASEGQLLGTLTGPSLVEDGLVARGIKRILGHRRREVVSPEELEPVISDLVDIASGPMYQANGQLDPRVLDANRLLFHAAEAIHDDVPLTRAA